MALVGLVITFLGFVLAMSSVGIASGTSVRLILVLIGIAVSLAGIMGVLNPAYTKNAVWKK
jgi:cytochrome c biogenesis protein CcdA